jgi:DNA-binding MurR/RpiR family transcriptional regulator
MKSADNTVVREKLVEYVRQHPQLSIRDIANDLDVAYSTLTKVLRDSGYRRRKYRKLADLDLAKLEPGS